MHVWIIKAFNYVGSYLEDIRQCHVNLLLSNNTHTKCLVVNLNLVLKLVFPRSLHVSFLF